jgi:predicted ribosomally synthesized peptide with SipW-like signal peptide
MRRKFIIGVSLVALAVAIIGSGVLYAYFSDSKTASNNQFAAGELLLTVGGSTPPAAFSVGSLKPGDSGTTTGWAITKAGSVPGDLSVAPGNLVNSDNGVNAVETATGDTAATGELGANLNVALWVDADTSGTWSSGDYYLKPAGGSGAACVQAWQAADGTTLPSAAFDTLNNMATKSWSRFKTSMAAGSYGTFKVSYNIPTTVGNVIQTDTAACDITFTLDQS